VLSGPKLNHIITALTIFAPERTENNANIQMVVPFKVLFTLKFTITCFPAFSRGWALSRTCVHSHKGYNISRQHHFSSPAEALALFCLAQNIGNSCCIPLFCTVHRGQKAVLQRSFGRCTWDTVCSSYTNATYPFCFP